jgi:hypothetical protein
LGVTICGPIEQATNEQKPLAIIDFIKLYAIPFFANQIHFEEYGFFLNGEYSHALDGLIEAIEEEFKTKDKSIIAKKLIYFKTKPSVNSLCYCGSGKNLNFAI